MICLAPCMPTMDAVKNGLALPSWHQRSQAGLTFSFAGYIGLCINESLFPKLFREIGHFKN